MKNLFSDLADAADVVARVLALTALLGGAGFLFGLHLSGLDLDLFRNPSSAWARSESRIVYGLTAFGIIVGTAVAAATVASKRTNGAATSLPTQPGPEGFGASRETPAPVYRVPSSPGGTFGGGCRFGCGFLVAVAVGIVVLFFVLPLFGIVLLGAAASGGK